MPTKPEKILIAMHSLSAGTLRPCKFEDIVVKAFKLFPAEFQLRGYPGFPDSSGIEKPLRGALQRQGLVQAALGEFSLTEKGLVRIADLADHGEAAAAPRPLARLACAGRSESATGVAARAGPTILGRRLSDAEQANARTLGLKDLELTARIKTALARLGWTDAGKIAEGSLSQFLGQKHIGGKAVTLLKAELNRVIAPIPGLPPLPESTFLGRDFRDDEESAYAQSIALDELALPEQGALALKELGIVDLRQLAGLKMQDIRARRDIRTATSLRISAAVQRALFERPTAHLRFPATPEGLVGFVDWALDRLDDRTRQVVMARHGLWGGARETLERVSLRLGFARERIRQLQEAGEQSLRRKSKREAAACLFAVRQRFLPPLLQSRQGFVTPAELGNDLLPGGEGGKARLALGFCCGLLDGQRHLKAGLVAGERGLLFESEPCLKRYQATTAALLRILGRKRRFQTAKALAARCPQPVTEDYVRRCSAVSDRIGQDHDGLIGLRDWPFFNVPTLAGMAHRALLDLRTPSHWTRIVRRMERLFPHRAPFNPRGVVAALRCDKAFVLAGPGTWALAERGLLTHDAALR